MIINYRYLYLRTSIFCFNVYFFYLYYADCPLDVDLPVLPSSISCHLHSTCNAVTCCMMSLLLQRNLATTFSVNQCNMTLTVTIEKQIFVVPLLDFEWGEFSIYKGQ